LRLVQVGVIGVYSVYALGYYATRQERRVSGAEYSLKGLMLFGMMAALIGGSLLKKREGGGGRR